MTKVLLIGNGAREHTLAEAFKRNPEVKLYSYMKANNPGIGELSEEIKIGVYSDQEAISEFAEKVKPDFAFIGPEDPLDQGVVDSLKKIGVESVGPIQALAKLETSKGFTRELMAKYDIKGNAKFKNFKSMEGIKEFLEELDGFVVKPDGLTGGKGVKVQGEHLDTVQDALDYCEEVLKTHPYLYYLPVHRN